MNMNELMSKLPKEILAVLNEADDLLNPTHGMTALEAHVHTIDRITKEFYEDVLDEASSDPFERIAQREEDLISLTGRNYADRIIAR